MKILIVVAVLFSATQANTDIWENVIELVKECAGGRDLLRTLDTFLLDALPLDNTDFTDFFTCYYDKLGVLKGWSKIDEDLIKAEFIRKIKHMYGTEIDAKNAEKLVVASLEHCPPLTETSINAVIKLRNCVIKHASEHADDYRSDIWENEVEVIQECAGSRDVIEVLNILTLDALPLDNRDFTYFFTCYYDKLGVLKGGSKIDEDLLKYEFIRKIRHMYGTEIYAKNAKKLVVASLEHCPPLTESGIIAAIKLRNCVLKYATEHARDGYLH